MRRNWIISAVVMTFGVAAMPSPGSAGTVQWQTPAKWHRTLKKSEPGTLALDADGVEFRSAKFSRRWKYIEIHTFDLSQRELTLLTYDNRHWHEPGERPFRFSLGEAMLPEIAAQFAERVEKPVRNGVPKAKTTALAEIPAHHRVWSGGSNGTLRLKKDGIDYVTENGRDSRTWRWDDIRTIANPDPYELRVMGYREAVDFDLKQPLPRAVFEQIWDRLYAAGLNLSPSHLANREAQQ